GNSRDQAVPLVDRIQRHDLPGIGHLLEPVEQAGVGGEVCFDSSDGVPELDSGGDLDDGAILVYGYDRRRQSVGGLLASGAHLLRFDNELSAAAPEPTEPDVCVGMNAFAHL